MTYHELVDRLLLPKSFGVDGRERLDLVESPWEPSQLSIVSSWLIVGLGES